jgi:hypothetical protein
MRERIGVGIRALRRDRLLYRRELALRIQLAARLGDPDRRLGRAAIGAGGGAQAGAPRRPEERRAGLRIRSRRDRLTIGFSSRRDSSSARDSTSDSTHHHDGIDFKHPLAPGSEANYRFASGDSSTVSFPNGRTIRLRELRIIPRRLDVRLLAGLVLDRRGIARVWCGRWSGRRARSIWSATSRTTTISPDS